MLAVCHEAHEEQSEGMLSPSNSMFVIGFPDIFAAKNVEYIVIQDSGDVVYPPAPFTIHSADGLQKKTRAFMLLSFIMNLLGE